MSHYYITDNNLKNEYRTFKYTYKNNLLEFTSDLGVFSKDRVDFGTNVLLNSLPDLKQYNSLLDVGCGVGVIGITLSKTYPNLNTLMIDVNERCIELANKNSANNKTKAQAILSNLYENIINKYDIIISNPPIRAGKKVVFGVVEGAYNTLNDKGEIYVVIQKKQGAESLLKRMNEVFSNAEVIKKEKGYYIIKSIK